METEIKANVCVKFCKFYKAERSEPEKCGSYEFLMKNLTLQELKSASVAAPIKADTSTDSSIKDMVCSVCNFRVDGCDFRDGLDSPPCGGYNIVSHLLMHTISKA
jgi:hypothetical protein